METIFGLLIVLLPLIFKVIEKKLQQSGRQDQAGKVREVADHIFGEDKEEPAEETFIQPLPEKKPVAVVARPVEAPVRHKKPAMLMEEPPKKKKEKIDPKKLVLYSEIMKPKFME